jgi:hypothetical protein
VSLDVSASKGSLQLRWLEITRSVWQEPQSITSVGSLKLKTPGQGSWAALVLAEQ